MKILGLILTTLLSYPAIAQVKISCINSSGLIGCSSPNIPPENSVSKEYTTVSGDVRSTSQVELNNAAGDSVDLSASPDTPNGLISLLTYNKGLSPDFRLYVPGSVGSDKASKPGQDVNLVGDLFGKLEINVSGLKGANGRTASQLCLARVSAGFYGVDGPDEAIREFRAVKNLNTCTPELLAKIASVAPPTFCPAGYDYKNELDNSSAQGFIANRRRYKNRCVKSTPRKTCNFTGKLYSCTVLRSNICESLYFKTVGATSSNFGALSLLSRADIPGECTDGMLVGRYSVVSFDLPQGLRTVLGPPTASDSDGTGICGAAVKAGNIVFSYGYNNPGDETPQGDYNGNVTSTFQSVSEGDFTKSINTTSSCEAEAASLGLPGFENLSFTQTELSADIQYAYKGETESCDAGWQSSGLTQDYPFTDSGETISCTTSSCGKANLKKSFDTKYGASLAREPGQSGSYGGHVNLFVYDIVSAAISYANGSNGEIGANDLMQTSTTKYCSKILDNNTTGLSALSPERNVPAIGLHAVTFYPFMIQEPTGLPSVSFPPRSDLEAVGMYKKMDSTTRDFIFKQVIKASN